MEKLLSILTDCRPDVDFSGEAKLIDDEILTSLDVVVIVGEINEAYGVDITIDDLTPANFNSASSMFALIERLLNE